MKRYRPQWVVVSLFAAVVLASYGGFAGVFGVVLASLAGGAVGVEIGFDRSLAIGVDRTLAKVRPTDEGPQARRGDR